MDKYLESSAYPVYNKAMFATFDTLKYYKRLEHAGFTSDQAQAAVDVQKDVLLESFESLTEKLATKEDVRLVKEELKEDIRLLQEDIKQVRKEAQETKAELKAEIQGVRTELKAEIAGLREEFKDDWRKLREEFKADITKLHDAFTGLKTEMAVIKVMMGVLIGGVVALVLKAFFM